MPREKSRRPRQGDLPGVEGVKDKKLKALGDEFIDLRDNKAELAKEMTACEAKIQDRMKELDLSVFVFGDQEISIKAGKNRVKIKTIKTEGHEEEEASTGGVSEDAAQN